MKKTQLVLFLIMICSVRISAQTYPYWDSDNPYTIPTPDTFSVTLNYNCESTNAVFALVSTGYVDPTHEDGEYYIERWTPCDGWGILPGCVILSDNMPAWLHANRRMIVHDHYLYVVGQVVLNGTNNPVAVARFDFNTGTWSPIGQALDISYRTPWAIAVDSLDKIYVGFYEYGFGDGNSGFSYDTGYAGQTVTNLLIVSTNEGVSWNSVSNGLVVGGIYTLPGIEALYADGTNLYIGGDFSGAAGQPVDSSLHVIMWAGDKWRNLDGVTNASGFGEMWGVDKLAALGNLQEINSIVGIGTNIYVAGIFDTPNSGIARFSNVTGHSLPIDSLNPYTGGSLYFFYGLWGGSLAVNNGQLYLAGDFIAPNYSATNYACLLDPEGTYPTHWTNVFPTSINDDAGNEVSCTLNGNAIYVATDYGSLNRLVLGPDGPEPTAQITNLTQSTISAIGSLQSQWWVLYSYDQTNWSTNGTIALWNGTGVAELGTYSSFPKYWKLANNCTESSIYTNTLLINVQFSAGQTPETNAAAVGFLGDYWNIIPDLAADKEQPIDGGDSDECYAEIQCLNNLGILTAVTVYFDSEGDPPFALSGGYAIDGEADAATNSLMQSIETEDSGPPLDVGIGGLDPSSTYDIYLYGLWQDGLERRNATFEILTDSCPDVAIGSSNPQSTDDDLGWDINTWQEGKQYVVFRNVHFTSPDSGSDSRYIQIKVSAPVSGEIPVVNGLQIVSH